MSKETIQIVCEGCDSEYKVTFESQTAAGMPDYCPFCGESVDLADEERDVEEDTFDKDDTDEWS
jgi:transcription initiation factor IIE alpha subunit